MTGAVDFEQLNAEELKARVPERYSRSDVSVSGAAIDPSILFRGTPGPVLFWTWERPSGRLLSTKPIGVRLWHEEGAFYAANETLSICAIGRTPQEALRDFSEQIVYFHEYYKGLRDDQVTGLAARLRGLYADLFIEQA